MADSIQWQLQSADRAPEWFVRAVRSLISSEPIYHLAQLLWQRGIQDPEQLAGFLNPRDYQPTSAFAFGEEMHWAVQRLHQAYLNQEKVAIWGDFDADGVTATAVLWDGMGQFFPWQTALTYYIPNRLTESHGLSRQGLDLLQHKGCCLIVTCDTGSTNPEEIAYANSLGMDVIVTDHHTLPETRPAVTAIINPRSLPANHPLATLSGVAVAYKLMEALYETLPDVPQMPLESLLDLVAIGLIADLVELKGDCRYLAQRGIEQLQKQATPATATRPGVAKLLEFCKRSGDRPTDISFGLGPRINAVSRIQGDAHFCVELLTSQDSLLCNHLAEATELANTRRKALQRDVTQQVVNRLAQVDFSTTSVIVLADEQWQPGVLGLVAGQIAQEYGKPTILLNTDYPTPFAPPLARGSARSVHGIDLYQLVKSQDYLLHRFGGHPFAAGLSLPIANLPLFTEAINQQLRQSQEAEAAGRSLSADLVVTVKDLGKQLFQELKLLEPCGMGNPVPKLLIRNCWFAKVWNRKIQDRTGKKVEYIKTEFELWDDSASEGFLGVWWGHYKDDIPQGRCDAIAELDFNTYTNESKGKKPHYEVRLIAVRPWEAEETLASSSNVDWILDWRQMTSQKGLPSAHPAPLVMERCPHSWAEFQVWFRRSRQAQKPLAIAYAAPAVASPVEVWRQLVGIAKYLHRTGNTATRQQFLEKLEIGDRALQVGFKALTQFGFAVIAQDNGFQIRLINNDVKTDRSLSNAVTQFLISVKEDQFRRHYFFQVPLDTIRAIANQTSI